MPRNFWIFVHWHDIMERKSKAIRIKLKNVKNEFNEPFMEESRLLCQLLILLDLLMNGSNHEEPGFSLSVKALAKIILYSHRIKEGEENHLENSINDTTQIKNLHFFFTLVYIELFSATRSSGTNAIFYPHGLCVSYDRILRITHGLGEALLQLF